MSEFYPLFSGWSIDEASQMQDYNFNYLSYNDDEVMNHFDPMIPLSTSLLGADGGDQLLQSPPSAPSIDKRKMYHNANERGRRKKINSLYSSLRTLLPATHPKKRLSNPDTVAQAVKYIPEFHKKLQLLSQKKHQIMTSSTTKSTSNATQVGNREILLQISTIPISEVIIALEDMDINHLILTDVSSSQSSTGTTRTHLFLKVEANHEIDSELLKRIQGLKFS